jgi:hypothetical protein
MAFMTAPTAAGGNEDRKPLLMYNAKAGRMFLANRKQDTNGEWSTEKVDVTMNPPAFAVDFGRLEVGWAHFQDGQAPQWAMSFHGQPVPAQPASPGNDSAGKTQRYRAAFRVPVIGRDIGGVREFGGNSGVSIEAMNALHTAWEALPASRAGQIPVVKMTGVLEVKSGQGSNFQPVFTIQQCVDRPAALGDRMVPPPNGAAAPVSAQQAAEASAWQAHGKANGGSKHVGPPATAPNEDDWSATPPSPATVSRGPAPAMDDLSDEIPF